VDRLISQRLIEDNADSLLAPDFIGGYGAVDQVMFGMMHSASLARLFSLRTAMSRHGQLSRATMPVDCNFPSLLVHEKMAM